MTYGGLAVTLKVLRWPGSWSRTLVFGLGVGVSSGSTTVVWLVVLTLRGFWTLVSGLGVGGGSRRARPPWSGRRYWRYVSAERGCQGWVAGVSTGSKVVSSDGNCCGNEVAADLGPVLGGL